MDILSLVDVALKMCSWSFVIPCLNLFGSWMTYLFPQKLGLMRLRVELCDCYPLPRYFMSTIQVEYPLSEMLQNSKSWGRMMVVANAGGENGSLD